MFTMKITKPVRCIIITILTCFTLIISGCHQASDKSLKSPDAAIEAYQDRSVDQLLKLVALGQINEIEAGEYKHGNWDSVLNSRASEGPWFGYPMGVTLMGMQYANRILHDPAIAEYVKNYIKIATDDYAYSVWQRKTFGQIHNKGGNFDRLIRMNMLDDCGAGSAAMLEAIKNEGAYLTTELTEYLHNVAYFISETHWRLEDGSFWRPVSPGSRPLSLWGDDL